MKYGIISEIGRRFHMEDAYFLDMNFNNKGWVFGGIYDGHGGDFAALYTSWHLHRYFLDAILSGSEPDKAFKTSYKMISDELRDQDSGTTAVNFFIRDGIIHTANAGDARAVVIGEDYHIQLTEDHRLDNPSERERIEKAGGVISYPYTVKGYRGLMPTRSIGDEYFRSVGIIPCPSTSSYEISSDDMMLIAGCDGLFDVMENHELAGFVKKYRDMDLLINELKKEVLINRMGGDNLTVIIIDFENE